MREKVNLEFTGISIRKPEIEVERVSIEKDKWGSVAHMVEV